MEHCRLDARAKPQVLKDLMGPSGLVVARCSAPACGAVTPLEITAGFLGLVSLARLEGELRCTCGGRRGLLEAWPANLTVLPARDRLFLFVV